MDDREDKMKKIYKSEFDYYKEIFSWKNAIEKGYYDFPNYSTSDWDGIYSTVNYLPEKYFNFNQLLGKPELFNKIENYFVNVILPSFNATSLEKLENSLEKSPNAHKLGDFNKYLEFTHPIIFKIPKTKDTRRILKCPNFYAYCMLLFIIDQYKTRIIKMLEKDHHAISNNFNYLPSSYSINQRIQDSILIGHSKFFKTDFTNFYPTFYTHVISWLICNKKKAKRKDSWEKINFGNLMDKAVEREQDGETHGVPTGNLLTRIVIETIMSKFDLELEDELRKRCHKVSFYRYVDDFYFAYNDPRDIIEIKQIMDSLTSKYDFTLNGSKTMETTYLKISSGSRLVDYFSNLNLDNELEPKDIANVLNTYYMIANKEISNGIKGADKLVFVSLKRYLERLLRDNQKNGQKNNLLQSMLDALLYTDSYRRYPFLDNIIQYPFIMKLFQMVLDNAQVAMKFVELIKTIKKCEVKMNDNFRNLKKMQFFFNRKPFKELIFNKLIQYIHQRKNQETIAILTVFLELNIKLSHDQIIRCFKAFSDCEKDGYDEYDDFSILMVLHYFLHQNKCISAKYGSGIFDSWVIHYLFELVSEDRNMLKTNDYMAGKHWLLKYQLFYYYKYDPIFNKRVHKYIASWYKIQHQLGNKNPKLINFCDLNHVHVVKNNNRTIDQFYLELLGKKFSFTTL